MRRKIGKSRDGLIVELPDRHLKALNLSEGDDVFISLDQAKKRIVVSPTGSQLTDVGIDETFAKQVDDFIERYKPALEELARKNDR